MTQWVALLRGVNVGGITIKSAPLREVFVGLGLGGVRTVLASGNVLFTADGRAHAQLKGEIERALTAAFDYEAWIVLRTAAQVDAAARAFPFDAADTSRQPMVIFGSDDAALDELATAAASMDAALDPVRLVAGALYWNPPKGQSTSTPFAKLLAARRFKASTTSRNVRTLERVLAAANS